MCINNMWLLVVCAQGPSLYVQRLVQVYDGNGLYMQTPNPSML